MRQYPHIRDTRSSALWFKTVAMIAVMFFFSSFAAAQTVQWKKTKVDEVGGGWNLEATIVYPKPPDMAHITVRLGLTLVTYYERSLIDGKSEPVLTKMAMRDQMEKIERTEISFLDPGTGQIAKGTRYTFPISRENGYEAGEYRVVLTDARSNKKMGNPTTFTLMGDNEPVDRRSMVFAEKPKEAKPKDAEQERYEAAAASRDPDDPAYWEGGENEAEDKKGPPPPPEHMQKPGGCGCDLNTTSNVNAAWSFFAVLFAGFLVRRRANR